MKIQQSIFRRGRSGGDIGRVQNAWTLRLTHTDEHANKTGRTWQYATKQKAKDDIESRKAELIAFVESKGLGLDDVETFREWAEFAKANFYKPAILKEGRKVAGVKSHKSAHILIDQLVECFRDKPLAKFTKYDLDRYKVWRLEQGDRRGEKGKLEPKERNPVSLSTVNRGLAILKHLLIEAHDAGLIAKNVTKGSKAIDADAETARTRTLTSDEERGLLVACDVSRKEVSFERNTRGLGKLRSITQTIETGNTYLKALVLLGLDSGLRRGEILKLDWKDIDFDLGVISILGTHTKTQKARSAPLTERTRVELHALPNFGSSGKIFPFNNFKRSWTTALKVAKIDGFHFHDLRRTFVTRLQTGGVSIGIAAELAGHSRLETTQKHYTSTGDPAIVRDAAAKINAANEERAALWPDVIE